MSKVSSKLQITVPKVLADRYGIRPGDEVEWKDAGGALRLIASARGPLTRPERLQFLEQARERARMRGNRPRPVTGRGWTREELCDRGRSR